jgi:pyruvate formate lyase activating enzyme
MRCNYCEWRCELGSGKLGVCRMYEEEDGRVVERFPHMWSSYGASRIELIPLYHAYPGSRSLVIGTSGCNFNCKYCSNAFIAKEDPARVQDTMEELSSVELLGTARKLGCENIVFNVNEPTVSIPSLLELKEEATAASMPMGCLTNAYMTEESTETLASIFSFFNIGLKGLSKEFNRECIGIPSVDPILRNIRRLATTSHVEVITPVIQGVNDDELDEIADFIAGIDREIPWHVFRLLPEYQMKDARYPNIEAVNGALESARKKLPYIYFHNFVGSDWVDTLWPRLREHGRRAFQPGLRRGYAPAGALRRWPLPAVRSGDTASEMRRKGRVGFHSGMQKWRMTGRASAWRKGSFLATPFPATWTRRATDGSRTSPLTS